MKERAISQALPVLNEFLCGKDIRKIGLVTRQLMHEVHRSDVLRQCNHCRTPHVFRAQAPLRLPRMCFECGSLLCYNCAAVCTVCDEAYCPTLTCTCELCRQIVCRDHAVKCDSCKLEFCENHMEICTQCGDSTCPEDSYWCSRCGHWFCYRHISRCYNCNMEFCDNDRLGVLNCDWCNMDYCIQCSAFNADERNGSEYCDDCWYDIMRKCRFCNEWFCTKKEGISYCMYDMNCRNKKRKLSELNCCHDCIRRDRRGARAVVRNNRKLSSNA